MNPYGNGMGQMPEDPNTALLRALHGVQAQSAATAQLIQKFLEEGAEKGKPQGVVPRFVEDIPGKRVPYHWVIPVNFDEAISNNSHKTGSATLSEDGPFVVTEYACFWQVTTQSSGADADVSRAFLPPGRGPIIMRAATAVPVIDRDIIDFTVTLQLSGGDRLWQNTAFPAVCIYDGMSRSYVGLPGLIERNETLSVTATAVTSSTAANAPDSACRGTFWWICRGYKILRPIDYADSQGWAR